MHTYICMYLSFCLSVNLSVCIYIYIYLQHSLTLRLTLIRVNPAQVWISKVFYPVRANLGQAQKVNPETRYMLLILLCFILELYLQYTRVFVLGVVVFIGFVCILCFRNTVCVFWAPTSPQSLPWHSKALGTKLFHQTCLFWVSLYPVRVNLARGTVASIYIYIYICGGGN